MCELQKLMRFAKKYSSLGKAVQEQLDDLLNGNLDVNSNAIELIRDNLYGINDGLDDVLDDYFNIQHKR